MNNLKEKGADRFAASGSYNPVRDNTLEVNTFFERREVGAMLPRQASNGLGFERSDPLPSMFSVKAHASAPEDSAPRAAPVSLLTGVSPYVAAVVLCVLVCGVAIHVSTAKPSEEDAAKLAPATRAFGAVALAPSTPLDHKGTAAVWSQPAGDQAWSQTVETYKQLLAQQPREAQQTTKSDSERFLGQLQTWMNKTR